MSLFWGSPSGSVINNLPANVRATGDAGSNPESGRSPGEGNGNPLQYSCLGHPTDRGARRATVRGVTQEWDTTQPTRIHTLAFVETAKKADSELEPPVGPEYELNGSPGDKSWAPTCAVGHVTAGGRQKWHGELSGWVSAKRCCASFREKRSSSETAEP